MSPQKPSMASNRLISPLKYFGGKRFLRKWIINYFPPHRRYIEPYCGGLSLLLGKPCSEVEIVNDLDVGVVAFWRSVRDQPYDLIRRLWQIPYEREVYYEYRDLRRSEEYLCLDPVEQAAIEFCVRRQSRLGIGHSGWCWSQVERRNQAKEVAAWESAILRIAAISRRLQGAEIHHRPALALAWHPRYDCPETLWYLDPSYVRATRVCPAYRHEMSDQDHRDLAQALHNLRGSVVLSGYRSRLYEELYPGWSTVEKPYRTRCNGSGDRVEVLWLKPAAVARAARRSG